MKTILKLAICLLFCLQALISYSQPDFESDDVNDVPLDGGLSLLLAAGVGYGAKKAHDFRKKTKEKKQKDD